MASICICDKTTEWTYIVNSRLHWKLVIGDALAIALAVLYGLQFHQLEGQIAQRFAFTFLPWTLAWLSSASALGLYKQVRFSAGLIGLVLWAMTLASPLAGLLRAVWLGSTVLPLFVLIMGAVTALAIIIWRLIYFRILAKDLPTSE